ncbi:MAG: hypothetical protein ABJF07_09735, partial [Nisaea sp.]|uniref:hypothetical protein n=1 Tax=Nisaea sp. TaxID=2024842 RepID=UPI003266C031
WLGEDSVWTYRHAAPDVADAETVALNGPILSRSLAAGRFTDLVAKGAPVFGATSEEIYVPTPLGVGQFPASGQAIGHYALPGPPGLMHLPNGELSTLSQKGLIGLESGAVTGTCASLHAAGFGLPPEAELEKVERVGDQDFRILYSLAGRRFLPVVRCDDRASSDLLRGAPWISRAIAEERRRHVSVMRPLQDSTAVLDVVILEEAVAVSDGVRRRVSLEPGIDGNLRALLNDERARAVLVVTDEDVYLVDKDAAISTLSTTEIGAAQ